MIQYNTVQYCNIAIKMFIQRLENLCNCTEHLENFKGPRKCVGLSQNASIYLQKDNFKNDLEFCLKISNTYRSCCFRKVGETSLRDFACVHLSLVDGADILLIYFRRSTEVNSVMIFLSSSFE